MTAWRVVILDDRVNSFAVVAHLMQTLCGMALEQAEQLVVAFQRHGLHATARRA